MSAFSPLVRYFEEVAEQKSVRRAAERLHIAPSAVTRQIVKFEEQVGTKLFERLPRGVRLTAAGELMLANVRRMQREFDTTINQIEMLKGMKRGKVTIGVLQYLSYRHIPDFVSRFLAEYDGLSFTILNLNSPPIIDGVSKGEIDIGICWAAPASAPIRRVATTQVNLGLVVPFNHEWSTRSSITLIESMSQPLIIPTQDMVHRRMLDSLLRGVATSLHPVVETNSMAAMIRLVANNVGLAVMTRATVQEEISNQSMVHIPFTDKGIGHLNLELVVRAGRNLSIPAAAVLELLSSNFSDFGG